MRMRSTLHTPPSARGRRPKRRGIRRRTPTIAVNFPGVIPQGATVTVKRESALPEVTAKSRGRLESRLEESERALDLTVPVPVLARGKMSQILHLFTVPGTSTGYRTRYNSSAVPSRPRSSARSSSSSTCQHQGWAERCSVMTVQLKISAECVAEHVQLNPEIRLN